MQNTKGVILGQKGTRMAEDDEDWIGFEMTILKKFGNFFQYTNCDKKKTISKIPIRSGNSGRRTTLCHYKLIFIYLFIYLFICLFLQI